MNNTRINIYTSKKTLMTVFGVIATMPAVSTVSNYLRGDMADALTFFIITMITIILAVFYAFVYPDKWKLPMFIIDNNDLIVQYDGAERRDVEKWEKVKWRNKIHIRIDADRKSKLKYLNEISKRRYEFIFHGIKPKSIDICLNRLSESDRNIMREFIFQNYGDKLMSNKGNPAKR